MKKTTRSANKGGLKGTKPHASGHQKYSLHG